MGCEIYMVHLYQELGDCMRYLFPRNWGSVISSSRSVLYLHICFFFTVFKRVQWGVMERYSFSNTR